jgi:preprotein translocase subunit YajC
VPDPSGRILLMISALAQSSTQSSPFSLLIFLLPLGLMFFFMRSQKRKMQAQQALQRAAEVGDEILTTSGIFGTIIDEDDDEGTILVEIAPGTRVKMLRAGISRRIGDDVYDDAGDESAEGPIGS